MAIMLNADKQCGFCQARVLCLLLGSFFPNGAAKQELIWRPRDISLGLRDQVGVLVAEKLSSLVQNLAIFDDLLSMKLGAKTRAGNLATSFFSKFSSDNRSGLCTVYCTSYLLSMALPSASSRPAQDSILSKSSQNITF